MTELLGLDRTRVPEGYWKDWMMTNFPHMEESINDVEWFSGSWSVTELLENNDPDGIVEVVGDWVDSETPYKSDDHPQEWSDLCQLFYDWWGCLNLGSSTPEWDEFWLGKLKEEC